MKWDSSTITGIFVDKKLQIFDGRHRLTAIQRLSPDEFKFIFGEKDNDGAGGVCVNIYRDIRTSDLIFLSQSNYFIYLFIRFQ